MMRLRAAVWIGLIVMLSACAGRLGTPKRLTSRDLERHAALPWDDHLGRARFAADLGLGPDALSHARTHLEQTHRRLLIAKARGNDERSLRRELEDACDVAITIGRRFFDGRLVFDAVSISERRHRRDLAWSAERLTWSSTVADDQVLDTFAKDPRLWLAVWSHHARPDEPVAVPGAVLRDLGAEANDVRWHLVDDAIAKHNVGQPAIELVGQIAAHDPSNADARIVLALREAIRDGSMLDDDELLGDQRTASASVPALARARARYERYPDSAAAALHYAAVLLEAGLDGDVESVLAASESRFTTADQRDLSRLLLALSRATLGNTATYEAWRKDHPDATLIAASRHLLRKATVTRYDDDAQRSVLHAMGTAAAAALIEARVLPADTRWLYLGSRSSDLGRDDRRWAEQHLRSQKIAYRTLDRCTEQFDAHRCWLDVEGSFFGVEGRIARWGLESPEAPQLLRGPNRREMIDPRGFDEIARHTGTTLALSADFVSLHFSGLLKAEAYDEASTWLRERGNALRPAELAAHQLDLADHVAGRGSSEHFAFPFSAVAVNTYAEVEPSTSWYARMQSVAHLILDQKYEEGLTILLDLADASPEPAAALLRGLAIDTWLVAEKPKRARETIALLADDDPSRALFEGRLAMLEEDPARAAPLLDRAWVTDSSETSLLLASTQDVPPSDPQTMLRALEAYPRGSLFGMRDVFARSTLESARRIAAAYDDDTKMLDLKPEDVQHDVLRWQLQSHLTREVAEAESLPRAQALAERALSLLRSVDEFRDVRLELLLLADRSESAEQALSLARLEAPELGVAPLSAANDIVLLHRARLEGSLSDEEAWQAFRARTLANHPQPKAIEEAKSGPLLAYACSMQSEQPQTARALEVCKEAWQREDARSIAVRVNYSYVLLSQSEPGAAELAAIFASPPPPYDASDLRSADRIMLSTLHRNHGAWLAVTGNAEGAARAVRASMALERFGSYRNDLDPPAEQLPFRGEHARWSVHASDAQEPLLSRARLAVLALQSLDPSAAHAYADDVVAFPHVAGDDTARLTADRALHLAELLGDDLGYERVPTAPLARAVTVAIGGNVDRLAEIERLHFEHPKSAILTLARAEILVDAGRAHDAASVLEPLESAYPHNPLVATARARIAFGQGDAARAQQLFADATAEHPNSWWLRLAELPESITGERPGVPAWLRSKDAFDRRLSQVTDAELFDLQPRYHSHTEVGADGFFPLAWTMAGGPVLRAANEAGVTIQIITRARASRCVGRECLAEQIEQLSPEGVTTHFERTVELPAGEAMEGAFSDARHSRLLLTLPLGGRTFVLNAVAPHEHTATLVRAWALLRNTFAPLDANVPSMQAALLRASGRGLTAHEHLRARLERSRAKGPGCPIAETLASSPSAAAPELVLEAFLASPHVAQREAVISCVPPQDRAARRVAVLALLDESAAVHAWGATAIAHHPHRSDRQGTRVAFREPEIPLSSPDYFDRQELPGRAALEFVLSLPEPEARRIVQHSLSSDDDEDVLDAWIIGSLRPSLIDVETARKAVHEAPPAIALRAIRILEQVDRPQMGRVMRARFDSLDPTSTDPTDAWLAGMLAYHIAALAEPEDATRLAKFVRLARKAGGDDTASAIDGLVTRHASALRLRDDPSSATAQDVDALRWLSANQVVNAPRARPRKDLRDRSLPQLLPGRDWSYARVASPGLFASTLLDLSHRVDPSDVTQRMMLDRILEGFIQRHGLATLLDGGGLDTSAPVECARQAGDSGFVCVATVVDRDAVLGGLGLREYDSDAGLAIPLALSEALAATPIALGALPAILHPIIYDAAEDDENDKPAPKLRSERIRFPVNIAGHDLEYYAIVERSDDSVSIDAERYLFLGDKVYVFANDYIARRMLHQLDDDAAPLATDPEFVRLTKGWKDGSALQAVSMGLASPVDDVDVAAEIVVDGSGVSFRYAGVTDEALPNLRGAAQRLPPGAVSSVAFSYPQQDPGDPLRLADREIVDTDILPPFELLGGTGVAFAWYANPGDSLWQRWALIVPRSDSIDRIAKTIGIRDARSTPKKAAAGWSYAAADGLLIVASERALVETSLSLEPANDGGYVFGQGSFSGEAAARAIVELPLTSDRDASLMRFFASAAELVSDARFSASWDAKTRIGQLEGRVTLRVSDEGESEVIDQWLATARFRNAASLPREISNKEAEGTLRYRLAVADAKGFAARSVFDSPRVRTEIRDDKHIDVIVDAKASAAKAREDLTPDLRQELLETTSHLRIEDPRIVEVRDTIIRGELKPHEAAKIILEWVHGRIDYEITPRSLDAPEILEAGRGDCSEYARLTVALLRSAGIPAEVRDGMAAQGSEMVAHAWVAYHDGTRWHEIDPTWGRMSVTAGHLPLEVMDVLALISLDRLKIESIEAM